jgi:UDPglucose 6-dehydrogenase
MKIISIFGTGYVGLVTAVTLASVGHKVECFDIDAKKISAIKRGSITFYEPGLNKLVQEHIKNGRLSFNIVTSSCKLDHDFHFLAVGTPEQEDGSADLKYLYSAVNHIIKHSKPGATLVIKSTVSVGTNRRVFEMVCASGLTVVSNPEFLREGSAVSDSMSPDRIIIGSNSSQSLAQVRSLYRSFEQKCEILEMDFEDAELTKYAANAFLATKISFMNEISRICSSINADIEKVKSGMVHDPRINDAFMDAGFGYGGSCFPKDVLALAHTASQNNVNSTLLRAVDETNDIQKTYFLRKHSKMYPFDGKSVSVLGLSFKPNTDDVREAPALDIVEYLLSQNAKVTVYDPKANNNFNSAMNLRKLHNYTVAESTVDAVSTAEVIVLCTEWDEFFNLEHMLSEISTLKHVIDGRNIWNKKYLTQLNIRYTGIGR